ncbi:hypothetical protein MUO14_20360 [Halobacillus shinanisalinarum]|uniref:Uncharacterized protein n=1 Tax=Halobacillus shinanisalinarum TaxID=2932258 RepID=A0ABY4GXY9_9BACI|nr:hypothetical protein [Halobacillus shinanisalinarum]UOQ92744.1 hypothetical protein MUO14_20360 [Halobacillus shinanisalinarum]
MNNPANTPANHIGNTQRNSGDTNVLSDVFSAIVPAAKKVEISIARSPLTIVLIMKVVFIFPIYTTLSISVDSTTFQIMYLQSFSTKFLSLNININNHIFLFNIIVIWNIFHLEESIVLKSSLQDNGPIHA